MKKETESKNNIENKSIYYENIDAHLPGDDLGKNVLYFPSSEEVINASNKTNPFTNVVRENIELSQMFMCYDVKSTFQISTDILAIVSAYIANSVMMNSITIFEDPWNHGSLINVLKGFLRRDETGFRFSPTFYTTYNQFIKDTNDAVYGNISNIIRNYFYNYRTGIAEVKTEYVIPFINELVKSVSKTYADNGQRFIADIITNGCLDNRAFNCYLISIVEEGQGKDFAPEIRQKMVDDNAHAITYLNIALEAGIIKLSEISEAIAYSGIYYIKDAIRNIDWEKCSNRKESGITEYHEF